MNTKYKIMCEGDREATARNLDDAIKVGRDMSTEMGVFAVKPPGRKERFFLRRGNVAYPITARTAANELAMKG